MISTLVITKTLMDKNEVLKAENTQLLQKVQQLEKENAELKSIIKELISAIDSSTLCQDCIDKDVMCSECPWAQARDRGKEWTEEE